MMLKTSICSYYENDVHQIEKIRDINDKTTTKNDENIKNIALKNYIKYQLNLLQRIL